MSNLKRQSVRTIYPTDAEIINPAATNFSNWAKLTNPSETEMMAERVIDDYLTTFLPSSQTTDSAYNWASFRKDLEYLNRKLSVLRKTITSWDTYQINEVVTDKNILASRIASLTPNSGLLVNLSQSISINGETYGRGDIVYSDSQGVRSRIPAKSGGYYYPYAISSVAIGDSESSSTLRIEYHFATNNPSATPANIKTSPTDTGPTPAQTMIANVPISGDQPVYNFSVEIAAGESEEFDLEYVQEDSLYTIVYPYVRCFYLETTDAGTTEEEINIYDAVELIDIPTTNTTAPTGAKCKINNPTALTILVKVR